MKANVVAPARAWMRQLFRPLLGWAVLDFPGWTRGTRLFAQDGGAQQIVDSPRSYTIDVFIVLVLFGLALFAICRSSRRL